MHPSNHSILGSLDVGRKSKEKVVVSMRRERDGKGSGVEYDLYRQGRKKKR